MVSNTSITLVSLLTHGSLSPASTEMADQRASLGHHPSIIGVLPPGLSLASLVLSSSPFKCSLKLFQRALLMPVQRSFALFEPGVPRLLPAGLVSLAEFGVF